MATSTSSSSPISLSMSRPEYLSTLPPWRRLLARLNWHPVYEIEQETERLRIENKQFEIESRQQEIESKQREKQLDKEIELLKESNARIARFERELFSSSTPAPSTNDSSLT
jgi:hypothetical protein